MSGQSSSIFSKFNDWSVTITLLPEEVLINGVPADRPADANDDFLQGVSADILTVLEEVQKAMRAAPDRLTLPEKKGQQLLEALAYHGSLAYQTLFQDPDVQQRLSGFLAKVTFIGPTILSASVPFPWEVLFGGDISAVDPQQFWGFRYSPGRIIGPGRAFNLQVERAIQNLPADMLFCLHHGLPNARGQEWLQVRELLLGRLPTSKFDLFSKTTCPEMADIQDGIGFLGYLYKSGYTFLHFACHCRKAGVVDDELIVSAIQDGQAIGQNEPTIPVKTGFLKIIQGEFQNKPLVFLNACQSGTDVDPYRLTYNLPKMFMDRGAAALIATLCPVADGFAAEFSRKFYDFFLQTRKEADLVTTRMVGEALRDTRWFFWEQHHNPLGLAYGLYSLAFYHLELPQSRIDTLGGGSLI